MKESNQHIQLMNEIDSARRRICYLRDAYGDLPIEVTPQFLGYISGTLFDCKKFIMSLQEEENDTQ